MTSHVLAGHAAYDRNRPTSGSPGRKSGLVFEAFVELVLVLTLRPGQSMILDTRKRHESATANALISRLPHAVTQLTKGALSIR